MSKNGKIDPDGNNDQKDFEWFEKHSKTKHHERLKNEDIFNYIKNVEQNCRIEVSSGDEDYAGTKKSSNCSVRCSGTRFRTFKKVKSRITSRKNKSMTLKREGKRSSSYNATGTCNYCCSARKSYFRGNSVRENSRKNLNTFTKSISQRPNLSRFSYNRESSPTLYGWYSRKNHKTWPVTEVASLEVTDDWSQNAICDSRINRSNITDRKSAAVHTFKSLRRKKLGDTCYMNACPSFLSNEKTERNSRYRNRKHREETRVRRLNQESDINNFENQQPLNKIYSSQDTMFSYPAPLQKGGYKGRYTSEYRYPLRRSRQPTSWGLSLQSKRLTSTRLPETNSLLQRQTLQWENEIGPPSKAFSSIMETSIDKGYQRGTNRKNNTDQQQRRPDILGNRESCYHQPGLLRESGELCKVVPTHKNKQWLGCCCEDAERDQTTDCSKYCRCASENANDFIRLQRESTYRPVPMSKRVTYTAATFCKTLPKSVYSGGNDEGKSEINSSMEEDSQNEDVVCDNHASDVFDNEVRTNNYDEALDLRDLKSHISFLDDRARRSSSEVTRAYRKLSNDLKNSQRRATEAQTTLRRKIMARYPAGKEFSFAIRTLRKPMSRDTSGLRYDAAKSTCDCKELFHDPPAACSTDFCTCIKNSENAERNNSDLSRKISDKNIYCCCCSCSSSTSHDEKDPVKKLESFCERVKAVNKDIFHKPLKSTCSNTTKTNAQKHAYGASDKQNQSEFSTQGAIRRTRSIEREWLKNPACLRLEKSKLSHDGANLEKILIYPPRGDSGPPLTLYKRSSNISCRVKGDADTGFRYSVTYVQKFISPTWMPGLSPEVLSRETDKECDCSADYG